MAKSRMAKWIKDREKINELSMWSARKLFLHGLWYASLLVGVPCIMAAGGVIMFFYQQYVPALILLTSGIFFAVKDPPWRVAKELWEMRP